MCLDSTADAQLLARVQAGDVNALGGIYDRYGACCLRLARQLQSAPETQSPAEDTVFSVFMDLWTAPPRAEGALADWLLARMKRHTA